MKMKASALPCTGRMKVDCELKVLAVCSFVPKHGLPSSSHGPKMFSATETRAVFAAGIVVLAFHLSASLGGVRQAITGNALPVGIALILLGVLVMASRRKALVQMVGLFASENGIFFTAMAISQGMPLIIEIGVILDVVLGALVMGILVLRVRSSVDTDIADLESLKG